MSTGNVTAIHVPLHVKRIRIVRKIKSDLVLGSPSSGCQGVGICQMVNISHETACKCPRVGATIGFSEHGRLRISFKKDTMDIRCLRRHFSWGLFQVLEPYRVPEFVSSGLSINAYTIHPGVYPAWESEDTVIVDF